MTSSSSVHTAINTNLAVIQQGVVLLAKLGTTRYAERIELCYRASIGGHIRHVIEHYQAFLRALENAPLDYEQRARDPLVENDPSYAGQLLESIWQQLVELRGALANRPLGYCVETSPGETSETSVLRELEFLLSHTVHHYALVAVMARLQGVDPAPTFGIAPSTLKYQQSQSACAR